MKHIVISQGILHSVEVWIIQGKDFLIFIRLRVAKLQSTNRCQFNQPEVDHARMNAVAR